MLKAGGNQFGADIDNYYQSSQCCPIHGITASLYHSITASQSLSPARGLDKQLQAIYTDIATNPSLIIQKDLFTYTRSQLQQGITQVFGDVKPGDEAFDLVQRLRANADRFSGYKSAWQTAHIRNTEPEQLTAINSRYNVNWMRTEYTHTVRSARAASNWQDITRDADLYPFLEYMPSTAAEPRNDHKRLYGVIKPVDDPFWDTWMPPAGWGCRCSVKQVRTDEGANQPPDDIKLPPATMRNNPGKTGQIFTDHHPMIAKVPKKERQVIDNAILKILQNESFEIYQQYENGGSISIHNAVNRMANDYKDNLTCCNFFAKNGAKVEMLPKLHPKSNEYKLIYNDLAGTKFEGKSPDFRVNGAYYELESYNRPFNIDKIRNMISRGRKQAARIVIDNTEGANDHYILRTLYNRIKSGHAIDELWLLENGEMRQLYKKQ